MIYFDPLFTANQQHWRTLGIPYVAQSTATNYVLLSSMGDFVVDYEIEEVKVIPTTHAGGTFDPIEEAAKRAEENKEAQLKEQERAEAQSLRDGGKPKLEMITPPPASSPEKGKAAETDDQKDAGELMGNDLTKDPILI